MRSITPGSGVLDLSGCPIVVSAELRWGEMDAFGHLNNVHFFRYFEIARIAYFDAIGFRDGARIGPILASTNCRFRRPLRYPDRIHVGVRTIDVSEDRFTHEYRLLSDSHAAVAALGEGLVVSYDYKKARKAPLPRRVRERIDEISRSV